MGILLMTQDSSVRLLPDSPRSRCQFVEREASAAAGGFVHPQISRRCSGPRQVIVLGAGQPDTLIGNGDD
jgi:hypothetical protein